MTIFKRTLLKDYTPQTLASWVQQRRRALGYTQLQLAALAGYSRSLLQKIELGIRKPSPKLARSLMRALGITANEQTHFLQLVESKRGGCPRLPSAPEIGMALVGRQHELDALHALLLVPTVRIITITGAAGVGKTKLARHAMAQVGDLPGSQCHVALADLPPQRQPAYASTIVAAAIADAMAFAWMGEVPIEAQVLEWLQDLDVVLVLDHIDHLVAASAFLTHLVQSSPGLKLVISACERLHLPGEHVVHVDGLPIARPHLALTQPVATPVATGRGAVQHIHAQPGAERRWVAPVLNQRDLSVKPAKPNGPDPLAMIGQRLSPLKRDVLIQCATFGGDFSVKAALRVIRLPHGSSAHSLHSMLDDFADQGLLQRTFDVTGQQQHARYSMSAAMRQWVGQFL